MAATDLTPFLIRSFAHYKRKQRTPTALVLRGIQQLVLQPDDKADLQEIQPISAQGRLLKGEAENITVSKDPAYEFAIEVEKQGDVVTQLVSVTKNFETAYEVKFIGAVDPQGETIVTERTPPKIGNQDVFNRNEISGIFFDKDVPQWYRVKSVESVCVLETRGDSSHPALAILYPDFNQISFSSKVDTVLEIQDNQQLSQEIMPLISICKGMLSFIKDESVLNSEHIVHERTTVQALFLWKSLELLLTKLDQFYNKLDPKNSPSSEPEVSMQALVANLSLLVSGSSKSYFEAFIQPFLTSISQSISNNPEATKLEIYQEAERILINIQKGFELLRVGVAKNPDLLSLRKLLNDSKIYFPTSDACLDRIIKLWLTDGNSHLDHELWTFVADKYRYLLELNKAGKPLSNYPLTEMLKIKIFSCSDGVCSMVVATINNQQRTRTEFLQDLYPAAATPEKNQQFIKSFSKPIESPGGFYFSTSNMSSSYGDWMIKWSSRDGFAINSVTLQKIELETSEVGEIFLSDYGSGIFSQNSAPQPEQYGYYRTKVGWFDFKLLDAIKPNDNVTQLPFSIHPTEMDGTITKLIASGDGYVLCEVAAAPGTRSLRIKLGEHIDEIPELQSLLQPTSRIIHFYKGSKMVSIGTDYQDEYLAQSTGKPPKLKIRLSEITEELNVYDSDTLEVDMIGEPSVLSSEHAFRGYPREGHIFSRFQFFTRDNTVFMLLVNVTLTTNFSLWRIKGDAKFECLSHFDSVSRQMARYENKHGLGVLDVTGWVNHGSRRNPLSLLVLLVDSDDSKHPQRGVACRMTHGGVRIRTVKIDLRHF